MSISVTSQANVFLSSIIGGVLIALIYDIFRIKRKAIKTGTIITFFEDFIYWILVALVMFGVVYYSNDGEIRGYIFIGAVIGVILYVLLLSKLVMRSSLFIIRIIQRIIVLIFSILIYPIKIIFKILRVPTIFLWKCFGKMTKGARRIGRNRLSKTLILSRIGRNIRKKI